MITITKEEFLKEKEKYFSLIKEGSIFIYPTDTIYGIGCSALNSKAVKKIRELKGRPKSPFSIIPPSKKWIKENCFTQGEAQEWIDKLPGPYTLVLKIKNPSSVSSEVNPESKTLGVRIPKHWIHQLFAEFGIPIVTTSANKTGKDFMTSTDNLDSDIEEKIKFMIYEGPKFGHPSKLVLLNDEEHEILHR